MSSKTGIEWTDATWNPTTGCVKVSAGCKNCYAKHQAWPRLAKIPGTVYSGRKFEDVRTHPERLDQPLRWTRPRRIFVNSMSDLFHEDVPDAFIDRVFEIMGACEDAGRGHVFQILTKRPERMLEYMRTRGHAAWNKRRLDRAAYPPRNVWLGVSVEDQATADLRIPVLLATPAAVRWISAEPLLGPVRLALVGRIRLDWVVVGGESGANARPMHPAWVRLLRDQCNAARVAFHFKQWGEWTTFGRVAASGKERALVYSDIHEASFSGVHVHRVGKRAAGRVLDGRTWDEYPTQGG